LIRFLQQPADFFFSSFFYISILVLDLIEAILWIKFADVASVDFIFKDFVDGCIQFQFLSLGGNSFPQMALWAVLLAVLFTRSDVVIVLIVLLLSLILLLLTYLVGIEGAGLVIEVAFLILLVLLSIEGSRMLIILFKPRTATWGLILGGSASFESLSFTLGADTAWVLFTPGVRTVVVLSDTLGGVASLFGALVLRLDNISVNSSQAIMVFVRIYY
jgi:hypothetical protein